MDVAGYEACTYPEGAMSVRVEEKKSVTGDSRSPYWKFKDLFRGYCCFLFAYFILI